MSRGVWLLPPPWRLQVFDDSDDDDDDDDGESDHILTIITYNSYNCLAACIMCVCLGDHCSNPAQEGLYTGNILEQGGLHTKNS